MTEVIHIVVEKGVDQGKKITVPPEGGRMGRSSKNDIVLIDPMLSRHHCRLFFKTGDGLWITDLGSANQTLVNNAPVQETKLRVGDVINIGDTTLRVVNDGITAAAAAPAPAPKKKEAPKPAPKPVVDLGLADKTKEPAKKGLWGNLMFIEALVVIIVVVCIVYYKKHYKAPRPAPPAATQADLGEKKTLEISYEKVQAGADNIFRHKLQLTRNGTISVQIDDIQNNRHVNKDKPNLDKDYCRNLADSILKAGFFDLDERYTGIQPDILESYDLSVTIGNRTHRTLVLNRVEPDVFKNVREMVEECGKVELGLEAIQFSTEKLLQLAQDAYLQGQKLYDEREIKFENLSAAIKSLKEAEIYLETVDPKPEYYAALLAKAGDYRRDLDEKYDNQNFRAAKAIKMREWDEASKELQVLLQLVPDRSDPRNEEATKKLLEVGNHLQEKK